MDDADRSSSPGPPRPVRETHYKGRRPHRSRQLGPPRPDYPVADLSQARIQHRPVLGGLITSWLAVKTAGIVYSASACRLALWAVTLFLETLITETALGLEFPT